jgi:hypothetical protein
MRPLPALMLIVIMIRSPSRSSLSNVLAIAVSPGVSPLENYLKEKNPDKSSGGYSRAPSDTRKQQHGKIIFSS